MAVVLSCLNEMVVLNVSLHLLSGHNKVIVSAIHLVVSLGPGRVCRRIMKIKSDLTRLQPTSVFELLPGLTRDARPKLVREF